MEQEEHPSTPQQNRWYDVALILAIALIYKIDGQSKTNAPQNNKRDSNEDLTRYTFGLLIATVAIAIAGGLTFAAAILQWCAMRGQQTVMQRQLDEAVAEHRPWVSATAVLDEELSVFGTGASVATAITMNNSGNIPAMNAMPLARIYPESQGTELINPEKSHAKICEWPWPIGTGDALFPTGPITRRVGAAFAEQSKVPDNWPPARGTYPFKAFLVVCLNYRWESNVGSTMVVYSLTKNSANVNARIYPMATYAN